MGGNPRVLVEIVPFSKSDVMDQFQPNHCHCCYGDPDAHICRGDAVYKKGGFQLVVRKRTNSI